MDKKQFRKIIKLLFSNKTMSSEKITLVENDKVLTQDARNDEILNTFSSNAVKT